MLKAIRLGKPIHLYELNATELKKLQQENPTFYCPYCHTRLILKCGQKKQPHFAHKTKCVFDGSENESEEHYQAKMLIANWLKTQHAKQIEIEAIFKSIKRIADVTFEYKNKRYVIEIQKSRLSDQLFHQRTSDYKTIGIDVIWIFLDKVMIHQVTQKLNSLVVKNKHQKIIILNVSQNQFYVFEHLIWLNSKEVIPNMNHYPIQDLLLANLLYPSHDKIALKKEDWMKIKYEFRCKKWYLLVKYNKKLAQICYRQHLTLSTVPAEVGWPIANNYAIATPLFTWQTYVLVGIVMSFEIHACFTIKDIMNKLVYHFNVKINNENRLKSYDELKAYLQLLERFHIIIKHQGYYEYIKKPKTSKRVEEMLERDAKLFDSLLKSSK